MFPSAMQCSSMYEHESCIRDDGWWSCLAKIRAKEHLRFEVSKVSVFSLFFSFLVDYPIIYIRNAWNILNIFLEMACICRIEIMLKLVFSGATSDVATNMTEVARPPDKYRDPRRTPLCSWSLTWDSTRVWVEAHHPLRPHPASSALDRTPTQPTLHKRSPSPPPSLLHATRRCRMTRLHGLLPRN